MARCNYILGYMHYEKQNKAKAVKYFNNGIKILTPYMDKHGDLYQGYMANLKKGLELATSMAPTT